MAQGMTCPACGATGIDVCQFESMMVLRIDLALFTLLCPHCENTISGIHRIPKQLREKVLFAAIEVDAGMGLN